MVAGKLATVKGIAISADDQVRGQIIERLMCDLAVDLATISQVFGVDVDRCDDLETATLCANDIEDAICGMSLPEDDDDEDPVELGLRIGTMFAAVTSVEVFDQNGDGIRLRRG